MLVCHCANHNFPDSVAHHWRWNLATRARHHNRGLLRQSHGRSLPVPAGSLHGLILNGFEVKSLNVCRCGTCSRCCGPGTCRYSAGWAASRWRRTYRSSIRGCTLASPMASPSSCSTSSCPGAAPVQNPETSTRACYWPLPQRLLALLPSASVDHFCAFQLRLLEATHFAFVVRVLSRTKSPWCSLYTNIPACILLSHASSCCAGGCFARCVTGLGFTSCVNLMMSCPLLPGTRC